MENVSQTVKFPWHAYDLFGYVGFVHFYFASELTYPRRFDLLARAFVSG